MIEARVDREHYKLADHLPLVVSFQLGAPPAPPPTVDPFANPVLPAEGASTPPN